MLVADVFECPKCGGHEIEEICDHVSQSSMVLSINEPIAPIAMNHSNPQNEFEYSETILTSGGEFVRFQCNTCGWLLPVDEPAKLVEYLGSRERECKPGCFKGVQDGQPS